MDKKMKLRAGVIGCGRIGSSWDETVKDVATAQPKSHSLAYLQNSHTELVAVCDVDADRAQTAARKWNCPFFTDLVDFLKQKLDIISVCVPVNERLAVLTKITELSPDSSLLIEKPFAEDLSHGRILQQILGKQKGKVAVNFSRRYASGIRKLKNEIAAGHWGQLQTGSGYYGNGLLNNGSHLIDLLVFLLGRPMAVNGGAVVSDGRPSDPTANAILKYKSSQVILHATNHQNFTIFELDLLFTGGRLRLIDRGFKIETQKIVDDPQYPGFRILGPPLTSDSGLAGSLTLAVSEITNSSEPSSCSVEDALLVNEILAQIGSTNERS